MMINPKKYGRTIYDREQSGFTLSILLPMRSASSYLQSTLGVRRWVFRVFLTTISSSRCPPTNHVSLITNHPLSPCPCAISSLTITEVDEQICFGNWRDRLGRARCSEATFRKGRICACGGARSSQSEKTIWLEHCTRAIRL